MPWCDTCAKYWSPNSLTVEGRCPACSAQVGQATAGADGTGVEPYRAPWHFKMLVVMATLYVGWRLIQMVGWIV